MCVITTLTLIFCSECKQLINSDEQITLDSLAPHQLFLKKRWRFEANIMMLLECRFLTHLFKAMEFSVKLPDIFGFSKIDRSHSICQVSN